MFVSDCISINEKGHLTIGSADTVELAKEFGTPAYIFDENEIRGNLRAFRNSVEENYGGNGLVCYASKAFSCKEIYRIVNDENMGIDVVSGGEIYTALTAGFPAEKIYFHGNNKTNDELRMAVEYGVGHIVVDNIEELNRLDKIAKDIKEKFFGGLPTQLGYCRGHANFMNAWEWHTSSEINVAITDLVLILGKVSAVTVISARGIFLVKLFKAFLSAEAVVCRAKLNELLCVFHIYFLALALNVRTVIATYVRTFIPGKSGDIKRGFYNIGCSFNKSFAVSLIK